ncbi:hypothetical protein BDR07DRAFT_754124 [Suillus spraguei]|nr:hypothetical protein BDR07DRAFT_754124 [Suillus spraguei]
MTDDIAMHQADLQNGILSHIDEAIEFHRAALLYPPGHLDRSIPLVYLAIILGYRFKQQGIPSDLDEATKLLCTAPLLFPVDHPHRSMSLDNLANNLRDRFQQWGVPCDFDGAFSITGLYYSLARLITLTDHRPPITLPSASETDSAVGCCI